jgi:hypothetical protein
MLEAGQSRMARKNKEQRTKNKQIRTMALHLVLCSLFSVLLSGCLLTSGERQSIDALPDGGNISATFVGADGSSERAIETGANGARLNAIVIVQADRGELRLELLNPDGNVAFSVQARPDEQVTRRGDVQTDEQGRLRYRVTAQGARNGGYQVLYQRAGQ